MTRKMMRVLLVIFVGALALAGSGCERLFQKEGERTLEAGNKKAAAGDYRMAIKMYEAALDGTAKSAEVHYKLALIYDTKLNEPVSALHHLDRYLQLAPNGEHVKEAKTHQKDASLRLAESLKGGAFVTQAEAVRLNKENLDLRMQIVKLKAQKNAPASAAGGSGKGELVQKPLTPGVRTYVVKKGDTLGSIAAKFYKSKARWTQIRDANFENAKGTPSIKVGQELMVP